MPEALARADHDFALRQDDARPRRRKIAAHATARPLRLGLLRRHCGRFVGLAGGCALFAGFAVNALILQGGPHPAPLFAPASSAAQGFTQSLPPAPAVLLPPERPAALSAAPASETRISAATAPAAKPDKAGTAGQATPSLRDPIGEILRGGSGGEPSKQVLAAQKALLKLGYGPIKTDGVLGSGTRQAIERFERDRKLPLSGDLGGRTGKELLAAAAAMSE